MPDKTMLVTLSRDPLGNLHVHAAFDGVEGFSCIARFDRRLASSQAAVDKIARQIGELLVDSFGRIGVETRFDIVDFEAAGHA